MLIHDGKKMEFIMLFLYPCNIYPLLIHRCSLPDILPSLVLCPISIAGRFILHLRFTPQGWLILIYSFKLLNSNDSLVLMFELFPSIFLYILQLVCCIVFIGNNIHFLDKLRMSSCVYMSNRSLTICL